MIFNKDQFVPTKWNTAEDKAKFANHLLRFIESGYNENLFYKWFYRRLSMCFMHISHFDKHSFYATWFSDEKRQRAFIKNILKFPCYGDPTWTYSDVEKAIQRYLR